MTERAHELQIARLLVVHLADAQCHASTLFGGGFGVIPRRGQRLRVTIEDGSPAGGDLRLEMTADEGAGLGLAFGELQHLGELPALLDVRLLARVALALFGLLALLAVPLTPTLGLDHEDRGEGDGEGNDGGDDHAGPRGGPDVARLLGFCRATIGWMSPANSAQPLGSVSTLVRPLPGPCS